MKIIENYYIVTFSIIIIGIPLLFYLKLSDQQNPPLQIVIYGSNIEASILAYYINRFHTAQTPLNITLISSKLNISKKPTERRILNFCGVQQSTMAILQDLQMQYMLKPYSTYFDDKGEIYRIQQEYSLATIFQYGCSHFTAKNLFNKLISHLKTMNSDQFRERTLIGLLNKLMPDPITASGQDYLSQIIGLDQRYIQDYIFPVIEANYLHDINSLSLMYNILPLYCPKSLFINFAQGEMQKRILEKTKASTKLLQNTSITKYEKVQIEQSKKWKLSITLSNEVKIQSNVLFIIEDYDEMKIRHFTYYKTIVDGQIPYDDTYPEIYTIYFHDSIVLSVTRLCANECKDYRNSVYMVISKTKIKEIDLTMFSHHQISTPSQRKWTPSNKVPTQNQKFEQTQGVYRIQETEAISNNFEIKLSLFKNLANLIGEKYHL